MQRRGLAMPERSPQRVPFAKRSRTAQKRACWDVLRQIKRAAPMLGGRFYTHQYMHGENGWLDGYFLGLSKPYFYNFSLQTVVYAYKELVEARAWAMSYELAPEDLDPSIFERTVKDPVSGLYVTPPFEPSRYPEFDGMTRYEWAQAQNEKIANSAEIYVGESWTLRSNYGNGIGLHATIDVPFLTIDTVNGFIERILQSEANYTDRELRTIRYDKISHWGIEPNSVCDPWDWAA
jgi:hypothetical protein